MDRVTVAGAGLAGCEAAYQLAIRGVPVRLIEQKPHKSTPAHKSSDFAELVCSNSLRGAGLSTAPGLLKEELRRCSSLIMQAADKFSVPAGGALAVDRELFSGYITETIKNHPLIEVVSAEVESIPEGRCIIATGPLTEGKLASEIDGLFGQPLHFYDAAAPIVSAESIDMSVAFAASRYDKGDADYINCPMDKEQYEKFVFELARAREAEVHGFEDKKVFEGCMPVEVMARRGEDTLRFGPLKPVGLRDPRTDKRPYAVVQLRAEDKEKTMYNIVGFQTHLLHPEQKRVFGMIPGLEKAEFLRYGVMHRNSFISSPGKLDRFYRVIGREQLMFAGQMTGVEGYIESTASGLCCGINMARAVLGKEPVEFPQLTAIGALSTYISCGSEVAFQPMNINFGIIPSLEYRVKVKRDRYLAVSERALGALEGILPQIKEDVK